MRWWKMGKLTSLFAFEVFGLVLSCIYGSQDSIRCSLWLCSLRASGCFGNAALIRSFRLPTVSYDSLCHPADLSRHPARGFWQATLIQRRPVPLPRDRLFLLPVHHLIQRFQHHGAPRHHQRAHGEEPHPALRADHVEYRIRIISVMPRARFHPWPVEEGESAGQRERLRRGDGPGRGEEQQVYCQQDAGDGVETQVRQQGQLGPVWYHEAFVYDSETPVEDADEDFEGCGAY